MCTDAAVDRPDPVLDRERIVLAFLQRLPTCSIIPRYFSPAHASRIAASSIGLLISRRLIPPELSLTVRPEVAPPAALCRLWVTMRWLWALPICRLRQHLRPGGRVKVPVPPVDLFRRSTQIVSAHALRNMFIQKQQSASQGHHVGPGGLDTSTHASKAHPDADAILQSGSRRKVDGHSGILF